jgi:hypothetical protein
MARRQPLHPPLKLSVDPVGLAQANWVGALRLLGQLILRSRHEVTSARSVTMPS